MVIFFLIWIIGVMLFNLSDDMRGWGTTTLGSVLMELVIPGGDGYVAMAAVKLCIKKANTRFVFFGFAAIILIFMGVYIGYVAPNADRVAIGFWEMLLDVLSNVAAIIGALIYYDKDRPSTSKNSFKRDAPLSWAPLKLNVSICAPRQLILDKGRT